MQPPSARHPPPPPLCACLAPPHPAAAPCPACAHRDGPLSLRVHGALRQSRASPRRGPAVPRHNPTMCPCIAQHRTPAQSRAAALQHLPYAVPRHALHGLAPLPCASPHCTPVPPRAAPSRSPKLRYCAAPRPVRSRPDCAVAGRLRPVASSAQPPGPPRRRNLPVQACQHTTSRDVWPAQAQRGHGSAPPHRPSPGSRARGQTGPRPSQGPGRPQPPRPARPRRNTLADDASPAGPGAHTRATTSPLSPPFALRRPTPCPRHTTPLRNAAPRPGASLRAVPLPLHTLPRSLCAEGPPRGSLLSQADAPHALSARCGRPLSALSAAISPSMPMQQALCVNPPRSPGPWPPPAAPSPAPHARAAPAVLCRPHENRAAPLRARSCAVRRHASSSPPCAPGYTQPLHPERSRRLLLLW